MERRDLRRRLKDTSGALTIAANNGIVGVTNSEEVDISGANFTNGSLYVPNFSGASTATLLKSVTGTDYL